MTFELKVIRTKRNNQLRVALSRRLLGLKQNDNPDSIEIENIKFNFLKKGDKSAL